MIDWSTITLKDFAGFVSEELRKSGIDAILVGGACVTIYSNNQYQSYDLDYVTYEDMAKVKKVLINLGFIEKNKYFYHADCKWFLEFVSAPVAVGNMPVFKFNHVLTPLGTIKMLYPIDSIKDRLSSFYHWNDRQGLNQAINIASEQKVNIENLRKWSQDEGQIEKFKIFEENLNKIKK